MRARYYSPEHKRFVNADILHGGITDSTSLNRYAYVNGNPVSFVDPTGMSRDDDRGKTSSVSITRPTSLPSVDSNSWRKTGIPYGMSTFNSNLYADKFYESKAYKIIQENKDSILRYAEHYGVDPNVVASVIFMEQYYNYDWKDVCGDWTAFYGILDTSVGLGQIRPSTAKKIEEKGYVSKTTSKDGFWDIPLIGKVYGTETMARYKYLEDDDTNILYVAAYIKMIEDDWKGEYPEISTDPAVLGTLYNQGYKKQPHPNPQPSPFGERTEYFYDLMKGALS